MGEPYKICPQCSQQTALTTSACVKCGHTYRTQFVPLPLYQQRQCPKCNYTISPFEADCQRCIRYGASAPVTPASQNTYTTPSNFLPPKNKGLSGHSLRMTGLVFFGLAFALPFVLGTQDSFPISFILCVIGLILFLLGCSIFDAGEQSYTNKDRRFARREYRYKEPPFFSSYNTNVRGHWRRSRNGGKHWVSDHRRGVGSRNRRR